MRAYTGLDAAKDTDRFFRTIFFTNQEYKYHSFAYGDLSPSSCARRNCPRSPDHDMHSCRIDLRKERPTNTPTLTSTPSSKSPPH